MSRKLRSSLPNIASPVSDLPEQDDHHLEGGKKRRLMSKVAACNACRKRKSRCDGVRPCCGACNQQTRKCIYDVEPGVSRHKSMRHRLDVLETKHKSLQDVVHKIRDGSPEQVDLLLRRLKAGDVDGIEPIVITPLQMPGSPPDSLIFSDQDGDGSICLESDTGEQHPLVDDTSHGCCSILPPRHVFDTAAAGYLDSVDVLFHAYTSAQARHLLDIMFSSDQLVQPVHPSSALTQLCSIAAVGSLCVSSTGPTQTTKSFYNFAQYFLNSLVEENTLEAAKVALMLAYCDITTKATMAINHINLGLTLSEKCISNPSQEPTSATTPEWLVRRRLWTTLIILKGWIFSTTDLRVETNWLACHQMLRDFQLTTNMHWRDAIQLEMAKITTIKADVRSTLYNTKNFQPQIFAEARYQLQGWCRDLPESMCLHSLLDSNLIEVEDRSRTLITHLIYLSGLMLLPQYLAREWIAANISTADLSSVEAIRGLNEGFSAAQQSARMLSLLRPQQDIIVKRWFCTSISYTSSTMLLFKLSQQLLHSSPHIQNKTTFKPAWESLKCLQLCASKDHAAKVLYSRLQPHIAVIQAERLRISTLPRQLPVGDGHLFAIPSGDSALYHTAHALLDLVAQPFPIITVDG